MVRAESVKYSSLVGLGCYFREAVNNEQCSLKKIIIIMQGKSTIRWGILGAGRIAQKFASDIRLVPGAELVAVAAREPDRAKAFAATHGISTGYGYADMYADDSVDAIYIATTHNFHFEQSMECLRRGKAVLCEKPVTVHDAQFKQMMALAREKQVFLMEAMWMYFLPAIIKARDWILEGRIGNIKLIDAGFGYRMDYDPLGRMYNPQLAGGALLDLGIYPVAFSTYFMNRKPDRIQSSGKLSDTGVDETTGMLFDYGTSTSVLFASMVTRTLNTAYIYGDRGHIEVPDFFKASVASLYDADQQLIETFTDHREGFGYEFEIREATECIRQGKLESPVISHARSNDLQEILMEVRRQIGLMYPGE